MRATLNDVARLAGRLHIPAYVEDQGTGVLRHAVLRAGWATDERLLVLVTNGERLPRAQRLVAGLLEAHPELTSIVQNVNERRTNAILGHRSITLHGPGTMRDRLLGCTFSIGATSFYQTNPAQTEVLYRLAVEGAGLEDGMRVLDAYCGTGTIGICAAHQARAKGKNVQVTGVEVVRQAVAAARANAQANGVADACSFVCGDATAHMAELTDASGRGRTWRCSAPMAQPRSRHVTGSWSLWAPGAKVTTATAATPSWKTEHSTTTSAGATSPSTPWP